MGVVDEVKATADILSYIQRDVDLRQQAGGKRYVGLCPFHDEEDGSFFVFPESGTWKCYGCQRGGSIIDYELHKQNTEDVGLALDVLCEHFHIERHQAKDGPSGPTKNKEYARKIITEYGHNALVNNPEFRAAKQWLLDRDFTEEDMAYWNAGCGTGTMKADLEKRISLQTMIEIGALGHQKTEGDGLRTWDFIKPGMIMIPVFNLKRKPAFWYLRDPSDKHDYQWYAKYRDDEWSGTSLGIFNIGDLIEYPDPFVVEGVWDANQIKKRGFPVAATLGPVKDIQIAFMRSLREGNPVFPEMVRKKTLYFWYDRDENESGQHSADKAASGTYQFHDTYIIRTPNMGDDPDDHLRKRGLTMDDIEKVPVTETTWDIEPTDEGYIQYVSGRGSERIPLLLTNFTMDIKYHFVGDDHDRTKMVTVNRKGERNGQLYLKGEDTCSRMAFVKWLHQKTRTCNIDMDNDGYDRFQRYMRETDKSKTIIFSQYYGNIQDDIWLFDNGLLNGDTIIRADQDGIIWFPIRGAEGIRTPHGTDLEQEQIKAQLIPDEWFDFKHLVDRFLYFYPMDMVMVMLGYMAATFCRTPISRRFRAFPHVLLKGESEQGKSKTVNLMRGLLNAGYAPTDTCDSTSKAFQRHIASFINLPLELTEYDRKFEGAMKNIYDQNLYSKAQKTQGHETLDPTVNTAVVMTSEHTPSGKSLLNRCLILDFDKFKYDFNKREEYDDFWDECVTNRKGFGFLLELAGSGIRDEILERISMMGRAIVKGKQVGKGSHRLINTYAIVFGGFSALYNMPKHNEFMKSRFRVDGKELELDSVLDIINRMVDNNRSMIEGQDTLQTFFGIFNMLYNTGRLKDMVQVLPDTASPQKVRFHLNDIFLLVTETDNRGKRALQHIQVGDIAQRLRERYDVRAKSEKLFGENKSCYTLPYDDLLRQFHLTLKDVGEIDEVDATFDPAMFKD